MGNCGFTTYAHTLTRSQSHTQSLTHAPALTLTKCALQAAALSPAPRHPRGSEQSCTGNSAPPKQRAHLRPTFYMLYQIKEDEDSLPIARHSPRRLGRGCVGTFPSPRMGECTSISDPGVSGGGKDNLRQSSAVTGEEAPPRQSCQFARLANKTNTLTKQKPQGNLSFTASWSLPFNLSTEPGPSSLQEFSQRCPLVLSASLGSCYSLLSCSSPSPTSIKPLLWAETRSNKNEQEVRGEPRHEQTGSDPSPGTSWPGDLEHVLLPFWDSRMEGMINSRLLLGEKMK